MKYWMSLVIALMFLPLTYASSTTLNVFEETLYYSYQKEILSGQQTFQGFTQGEQSLYVDALWDLSEEGNPKAHEAIDDINEIFLALVEKLRVGILRIKYNRASALHEKLVAELMNALKRPEVETKLIYTLAAYEADILGAGHIDLIEQAKMHPQYFDISEDEVRKKEITDDIIGDIFHKSPDVTTYMNGEYVKSVKIFMFCRENRIFPCLMVMRNIHGEIVRNADGTIWTHASLASSAKGLPSYARNGNTPAGIMTIDSVMPVADQQTSFGKFRRMMLNFIPKSKNEVLLKSLMPATSFDQEWWRPTITARDIGRNLFRIHGTGKINQDPTTPYYPFMRTSGCIAQKENTYNGVTYKDQRELLDAIMVAMDMEATFENEVKVKGILYLIEIDDKNEAVLAEDLALRGIE